jgi:hypothetical protein
MAASCEGQAGGLNMSDRRNGISTLWRVTEAPHRGLGSRIGQGGNDEYHGKVCERGDRRVYAEFLSLSGTHPRSSRSAATGPLQWQQTASQHVYRVARAKAL